MATVDDGVGEDNSVITAALSAGDSYTLGQRDVGDGHGDGQRFGHLQPHRGQVRTALQELLQIADCNAVSVADLARVLGLSLASTGITALQPGDLSGLTNMRGAGP